MSDNVSTQTIKIETGIPIPDRFVRRSNGSERITLITQMKLKQSVRFPNRPEAVSFANSMRAQGQKPLIRQVEEEGVYWVRVWRVG